MIKKNTIDKLQKYITPNDAIKLLEDVDDEIVLNEDLKYRIENGVFSEKLNTKSTGIFYVDKDRRKIAGMIFVYNDDEILADLETIKEYRNMGIGTQLLKDAVSLGAKYLAVKDDNLIAINLYKKNGFKEYYRDDNKKLIYMSTTGKPHPDDVKKIK